MSKEMSQQNYKNWQLYTDNDKIVWLLFDRENASTNTLNPQVFAEFEQILVAIEKDIQVQGLVIGSAKQNGFIAGADVEAFLQLKTTDEAREFVLLGQNAFNHLASLTIPTVAMIDGFCLGGGLELALACRYRVATEDSKTRLGLPEVRLGIRPGWGGSERLPALIGAVNGLQLILTGRMVHAKAAVKLGIIDEVVPKRQLESAARFYILNKPEPHRPSFWELVTNTPVVRPILAKIFDRKLKTKHINPQHYPAPYAVIEHWHKYGIDFASSMEAMADSVAQSLLDSTAQNLVRVFFLQERLKNIPRDVDFQAKHIHVVGAGVMGGDIAAWCALKGMKVTLQDREPKFIAPALKRAQELFKNKLKTPREQLAAFERLIPDTHGYGIAKADVLIEAIYENLEAKQALFQQLEREARSDAVLATNTSSIPLDEINSVLTRPERLVGIHFFNPVSRMELVEIVHGKMTEEKSYKKAIAFVRSLDRLPLPVKSSPGFLVNRILMAYLMECVALYNEGISPVAIDKAALNFGMPMGPIELADTVGLDICLSVANNLTQHYGGEVPEILQKMVAEGHLGRKTGKGFYTYKSGKVQKPTLKESPDLDVITDRLILRLLNESMACLREHVVADGDLLDAGMVFGTGFAPFRGGPMQYICQTGKADLRQKLENLNQQYGSRFQPDKEWYKEV